MKRIVAWSLAGASLLVVGAAAAHSFGTVYNLPVPFWMYAYGASATLIVSFVIVAYFAAAPRQVTAARPSVAASAARRIKGRLSPAVVTTLRCLSAGLLLLCIASGLIGTPNTYVNFNMTFFWIVFALGFLYVSALVGDFYSVVNPWRVVCDAIAWAMPALLRVRARYPAWLGFYPALV